MTIINLVVLAAEDPSSFTARCMPGMDPYAEVLMSTQLAGMLLSLSCFAQHRDSLHAACRKGTGNGVTNTSSMHLVDLSFMS